MKEGHFTPSVNGGPDGKHSRLVRSWQVAFKSKPIPALPRCPSNKINTSFRSKGTPSLWNLTHHFHLWLFLVCSIIDYGDCPCVGELSPVTLIKFLHCIYQCESVFQINSSEASVPLSYTDWCVHSNATALTVDNITSALNGIDWRIIGQLILKLPDSKYDEIMKQFSGADDRVRAAVREWLLHDPLASWRRLIDQLYDEDEAERADSILHYAEKLTGVYMKMIMIHTTLHHMMHGKCTREKVTGL